jgi:Thioredoxin
LLGSQGRNRGGVRARSARQRAAGHRRLLGTLVRALPRGRPLLDEIANERQGELEVIKVNVDEEPELAERYRVASIPTILLSGREAR